MLTLRVLEFFADLMEEASSDVVRSTGQHSFPYSGPPRSMCQAPDYRLKPMHCTTSPSLTRLSRAFT